MHVQHYKNKFFVLTTEWLATLVAVKMWL